MARTAAYTRSKNGIGGPDPSTRPRAARDATGQAPGLGEGDGEGEGVAAGASCPGAPGGAGAGAASGVPGAGPRPGPLRVEVGTLGTVSETSLTVVCVVFSEALR